MTKSLTAALAAATLLTAAQASAQATLTCATLTNTALTQIGSFVNVALDPGDQITVTAGSGSDALSYEQGTDVQQCGFIYGGASCADHVFTAAATGVATIEKTGGPLTTTLNCSGGGPGPVTPTPASQAAGQAAAAAGGASSAAIGGAIKSAVSARSGGSSVGAARNRLFLSAQGAETGTGIWAQLSGTSFSGSLDGNGMELTLGADYEVSPRTFIGLALSYGDYEITSGGNTFDTEAFAFGPYISAELSDRVEINAYLLFADPDYTVGAINYSSDRVMAGVEARLAYGLGRAAGSAYLSFSGFEESLPAAAPGGARDIQQFVASIGTQIDFAPGMPVRPYVLFGIDAISFKDGATDTDSVSPRLGLGLAADAGPGVFTIDLTGGEVFDDARAISLSFGYRAEF